MKYCFELSFHAEQDFLCLERNIQRRIIAKLSFFEKLTNPLEHAKKLSGVENVYRFRIGDYRILVKPQPDNTLVILLVIKIGHRRDVYDF